MKRPTHNGAVLWRGPSRLDGSPIVAIITGLRTASANPKTGDMLQTWILRSDIHPTDAIRTGADASICGGCPHRAQPGSGVRTCYVLPFAFNSVFDGFRRGIYPFMPPHKVASMIGGRALRIGSYGDPGAVPVKVWKTLARGASGHTGYTHQWRRFPSLKSVCMASCDDEADRIEAVRRGWRTFTVVPVGADHAPSDVQCPASEESGKVTTCANCRLCSGAMADRANPARSVSIHAHGKARKRVQIQPLTIGVSA